MREVAHGMQGSYLLRVWRESPEGPRGSAWRYSVEDLETRQRRGFSDVEDLLGFIRGLSCEREQLSAVRAAKGGAS